jgi:hypothetical protein
VVWRERRKYQAIGKQESWLWLRLLSLPILALTGFVVILPARVISGPVALGVFYIALITLGPLTWFVLHRVIGAVLSPRLTRSESTGMAWTGLALLIVPALVVNWLQGPVFMASHRWNQSKFDGADPAILVYDVQPMQRFRLGEQGEIYTQTLHAPPGLRVERIDNLLGGGWQDTKTVTHSFFCRQGNDLHLAWPAGSLPPPLRLYWRNAENRLVQAEFRVDTADAERLPAKDFVIGWRDDGLDLPVPISRDNVQLGWTASDNKIYYRSLNPLQPGETFENDCVMCGYHRLAWQDEGPIAGVILRFHPPPPGEPWQYEVKRPK